MRKAILWRIAVTSLGVVLLVSLSPKAMSATKRPRWFPPSEVLPATLIADDDCYPELPQKLVGVPIIGLFLIPGEDSYLRDIPTRRVLRKVPIPGRDGVGLDVRPHPHKGPCLIMVTDEKPLFALHGKHGLEERIVPTVLSQRRDISCKAPLNLRFSGTAYRFAFLPIPGTRPDYDQTHRLVVQSGSTSQHLGDAFCSGFETYSLVWAGDLDRDNKLDVVVGYGSEKGDGRWTLYLSRRKAAFGMPFFGPVARASFSCGC